MKLLLSKKFTILVAALVAATLLIVYGLFNPATTPFPRCPFLMLTGWQCPGCGSQRAIHALLHGNLLQAWNFNAALVCSIPLLALMCFAALNRRRLTRLYALLNSSLACIAWLICILAWTVIRNFTN